MKTYQSTFTVKRLWLILVTSVILMFGILLYLGREIYQVAPPIPSAVKTTTGEVIFTQTDIETGQNLWQSMGGMQQGSIWGHGGYVAPDWSADWLQREAKGLLSIISATNPLPNLPEFAAQDTHLAFLRKDIRTNTYNDETGVITISPERAEAIEAVTQHYTDLFGANGEHYLHLRREYAMPIHATLTEAESKSVSAFFFWT